jgi:hypothetical protein
MRTPLLIGMLALAAIAPAGADGEPRSILSVEGGGTRIHDDDSTVGALRIHRGLGSRGLFRIQLGATVAAFGTLDLGVEFHPWPRARVSPFLGAGGGLMSEDEYFGTFVRGTAGLEAKLSRRVVLRLAFQAGTHDGEAGPHLATLGVGWRF